MYYWILGTLSIGFCFPGCPIICVIAKSKKEIWNETLQYNYKNGIIRESNANALGTGDVLGNLKDDIIRSGSAAAKGTGRVVGNTKNGVIFESSSAAVGTGRPIGSVKNGYVFKGSANAAGTGSRIGKVEDFVINGMEREKDENIIAAWHFLVKKIF